MNKIITAFCLIAIACGPADARRHHRHHRHDRHYSVERAVRAAAVIYVLRERDCPREPLVPTLCYWRKR